MNIAILGGSFNPIHNGHLRIVQTILASNTADKLWILPSANHPLKETNTQLDFRKRIELAQKAVSDTLNCEVYDYDYQEGKPSYTADLMRKLKDQYKEHKFYFVIGYDIIPELTKWYDFEWLSQNANFIVINRPGLYDLRKAESLKKKILLEMEPVDISSSQIRKMLQESEDISDYIPAAIKEDVISAYQKLFHLS